MWYGCARSAQLALFLPHAVPGIIAALIWLYLYTPGLSPVLDLFGRPDITVDFLGVHTVLPSIVNIAVWSNLGYNMVIFYAALQAVPREVIEAAVVDGAGPVRTALQVKAPLVRASVVMVAMFTLIWALQLFTEPMLLSQSTPMINSRFSPSMYIFDAAFTRNNYGLAAAASVVLLARARSPCPTASPAGPTDADARKEGSPMSDAPTEHPSLRRRPRAARGRATRQRRCVGDLRPLHAAARAVAAARRPKDRDALFSSDLLSPGTSPSRQPARPVRHGRTASTGAGTSTACCTRCSARRSARW